MTLWKSQAFAEEEEDEVEQNEPDDNVEYLGDHAAPEQVAMHLSGLG
jgi:hypothetical protein